MASGTVLECSTSHEKDNFVRFSTLLIDGGTALLREVLDTICSPTSLRQGLTNNKRSIERSLKRDQKAILYPADGSPLRLESCDISLLIVMLKEVCKISFPSREELKTLPDVKRSEVGDNLERLKVCRNEVFAHAPKLELSNSEFERQWEEISTVMLQLAKKIKKEPKWKERIDHYRSVALTTKEEDCVRKLKEWHECEKEVLKEVQESRGEMKEGFANVLDVLDGIQGFMNSLRSSSNQDMQISKASMETASYKRGDKVSLKGDIDLLKKLLKGHGGWNDAMVSILGRSGKVLEVKENGDLVVEIANSVRVFDPKAVKKDDSAEGDDDSDSEASEADIFKRLRSSIPSLDDLIGSGLPSRDPGERLAAAARQGHLSVVIDILETHSDKMNQLTKTGKTALQLSCHGGHSSIVKLLLSKKANTNTLDTEGYTALHHAAFGDDKNGEVVKMLLQHKVEPNPRNPKNKATPLHLAVKQGNDAAVKELVEWPGCDVNIQDDNGETPLFIAIGEEKHLMADILIKAPGLDMTLTNKGKFNYLHFAALNGNKFAVEKLLAECPDLLNSKKVDGFTALHLAAINDHCEVATALCVQPKCNMQGKNNGGESPLHLAVKEGYLCMAEILVENGADVNAEDQNGDTCLLLALRMEKKHSVSDQSGPGLQFDFGLKSGNRKTFAKMSRFLVNRGANVHHLNRKGESPLNGCNDSEVRDLIFEKAAEIRSSSTSMKHELPRLSGNEERKIENALETGNAGSQEDEDSFSNATKGDPLHSLLDMAAMVDPFGLLANIATTDDPGQRLIRAADQGKLSIVSDVLEDNPEKINYVENVEGKTALQASCHEGHYMIAKLLLSKGADPEISDHQGFTALHHAVYSVDKDGAILQMLLSHGAKPNPTSFQERSTPLHLAVKQGNYVAVEKLVKWSGCLVNNQDENGETPLFVAIEEKRNRVTDILMSTSGLDLKVVNKRMFNYLQFAALKGDTFAVKKLLAKCPKLIDVSKEDGNTPLHIAAINDHCEVATVLCAQHCKVEIQNDLGQSPLHLAVNRGYLNMTKLLVAQGASVNVGDQDGDTGLHIALTNLKTRKIEENVGLNLRSGYSTSFANISRFLVEHGANVHQLNRKNESPLGLCNDSTERDFIFQGAAASRQADEKDEAQNAKKEEGTEDQKGTFDTAEVKSLLEGLDALKGIAPANNEGDWLVVAARNGQRSAVQDVLENHPDKINHVANIVGGGTALHSSCHGGHYNIVNLLLSKGADTTKLDSQGYTALHHAAFGNDKKGKALEMLLRHKVNPNPRDAKNNSTPLHLAVKQGNFMAAKKLTEWPGCDVNIKDQNGETPLFIAIHETKYEMIDILMKAPELDMMLTNAKMLNYLQFAVLKGDTDTVEKLMTKCPGLINAPKIDGFTPLHLAAFNDQCEIAAALCNQDTCNLNVKNNRGESPLHLAVQKGYPLMTEILVEHGANVNAEDQNGDTGLHLAIKMEKRSSTPSLIGLGIDLKRRSANTKSFAKICRYLLHHGANVHHLNSKGESPLSMRNHSEEKDLIVEVAAKSRAKPTSVQKLSASEEAQAEKKRGKKSAGTQGVEKPD